MSSKYYKVKYSDRLRDYCGVVKADNPLQAYINFSDDLPDGWIVKDIEFMESSEKQNNLVEIKRNA